MSPPSRFQLRNFLAPYFFFYGAIGIAFPFYTLWLRDWGFSDSQIALLGAVNASAAILGSQFWGYAADVLWTPKRLYLICLLCMAFAFSLFPWAEGFVPMMAAAFAYAVFSSPTSQFLTSLLLANKRGETHFSLVRSLGSIGFILVNLVMGRLCKYTSLAIIFPAYAGMLAISALTILPIPGASPRGRRRMKLEEPSDLVESPEPAPIPREMRDDSDDAADSPSGREESSSIAAPPAPPLAAIAEEHRRPSFAETQSYFFRNRAILLFLALSFVYQVAHAVSHGFQSLWIRDLGGSESTVALCYSLAAGAEVLVFLVSDRLLANRSAAPLLFWACIAQVLRWGIIWAFPSLPAVVASNVLHAVTFGLFFSAAVVYIHRLSPPRFRTSGQTVFNLAYGAMAGLGSNLLGSWVIGAAGLRGWYGAAALLSVAAAVIALFLPRVDAPGTQRTQGT